MMRVRVVATGWDGAPGLNTAYFVDSAEDAATCQAVHDRVHAAFVACNSIFPTSVVHTVSPQVDIIDPVTGDMTGAFIVAAPQAPIVGSSQASFAPLATAVLVRMGTGVFDDGRRITGRHFLSPIDGLEVATDGGPSANAQTAGQQFGDILHGVQDLEPINVVWRRPRLADATATPPVQARPGRTANVTTVSVPDKLAVLRSRRD